MHAFLHRLPAAALLLALACTPAAAQADDAERIAFAGGELTITELPDFEKVLAFDGRELARAYFVSFDKIASVSGTEVAFVSVGPGGNACAPAVALIWQDQDGEVQSEIAGEDECAVPTPAISDYAVFFVPYLLPGQEADVRYWIPGEGLRVHGRLAYAPEPGTTWAELGESEIRHPLEFLRNADLYAAAQALLGDALEDTARGLGVSGAPERGADGVWVGTGCVPHACGVLDSLIAVDPDARALYFAQKQDEAATRFWPERTQWPAAIAQRIPDGF